MYCRQQLQYVYSCLMAWHQLLTRVGSCSSLACQWKWKFLELLAIWWHASYRDDHTARFSHARWRLDKVLHSKPSWRKYVMMTFCFENSVSQVSAYRLSYKLYTFFLISCCLSLIISMNIAISTPKNNVIHWHADQLARYTYLQAFKSTHLGVSQSIAQQMNQLIICVQQM